MGKSARWRSKGAISLPVFVLGAADDRIFTPSEVKATAAAWNTSAHLVPGLAHDVMLDTRWREAADRLLGWLDGVT